MFENITLGNGCKRQESFTRICISYITPGNGNSFRWREFHWWMTSQFHVTDDVITCSTVCFSPTWFMTTVPPVSAFPLLLYIILCWFCTVYDRCCFICFKREHCCPFIGWVSLWLSLSCSFPRRVGSGRRLNLLSTGFIPTFSTKFTV